MNEKLKVAAELALPLDAVTQTMAAIARKGAGKTYLASMIAEQMLDAHAQVIVVDPVGNWWGLRVAADGKSKGKDIFIIGGDHGDVPLVPEAGARIARLLVEKPVSAILDVSNFRKGQRLQFLTDFGEEFFHLKKRQRSPVHLFLEEAQLLLPQRFGADQARLQGAWTDIVRLGRNYGIGETMISQRPQSIDKEVLNMTECLFALQVNGVAERKALEDWVREKNADRSIVNELPSLGNGEGFVWSPSWLRIFKRVKFSQKTTFNASATPEVGKAVKSATLSTVDVEKLRNDLQEVVSQAEKDDPKALRKQISELQRELAKKPSTAPVSVETVPDPDAVRKVVHAEVEQIVRNVIRPAVDKSIGGLLDGLVSRMESLIETTKQHRAVLSNGDAWNLLALSRECEKGLAAVTMVPRQQTPRPLPSVPCKAKPSIKTDVSSNRSAAPEGMSRAQIKILSRLVELLNATGCDSVPKEQLAAWSEYSPTGGGFNNYLGSLRSAGLIDYPQPGMVAITEAGGELADPEDTPSSDEEMLCRVERVLGGSEGRLLRAAAEFYPQHVTKELLAAQTGFSSSGGGFNNYLGHMRTLGFITYPSKGCVRAADFLFVEGSR
jgi:hypothetical protein